MAGWSMVHDRLDEAFIKIMIEELAQSVPQSQDKASLESVEDLAAGQWDKWDTAIAAPSPPDLEIPTEEESGEAGSVEPTQPTVSDAPPAAPDKSVRWQLRVVHKNRPECLLPLEDKPVTIGRDRENAIVARCDRVSLQHARFWLDEHRPRVDDLGSRNGILVNGVKVPAAYLRPNDEVRIGSVRVYVQTGE